MWARLAKLVDPAKPSVEEVLQRVGKLWTDGKQREAINYGAEQNRRLDDRRLSTEIMRMRHLAFTPGTGRPDWPPNLPDRFKSPGIPEIAASELTTATLGGGILHHGAIIVRGLIKEPQVSALRATVDSAIDGAAKARAGEAPEGGTTWYSKAPMSIDHDVNASRVFTEWEAAAVLAGDSPRAFETVVELYERMGVFKAVEGYLGERPALSLAKTVLRRVPITNGTDWHQDGAFLGEHIRVVNLWLALSDCGVDAPGLDVVPRRIPHVVETGKGGAMFHWSVGPDTVAEIAPASEIVSPVFKAGDAMMFDHLFLHRTGVRPSMTKSRHAIEAWMFAPSTFPTENFPLVV